MKTKGTIPNHYTTNTNLPLTDAGAREQNVGELLSILPEPPATTEGVGRQKTSG